MMETKYYKGIITLSAKLLQANLRGVCGKYKAGYSKVF